MFNIGDMVYDKSQPNEIYQVVEVNTVTSYIPNYTLYNEEKGYCFESFCLEGWYRLVKPEDVLKYGNILTDDKFNYYSYIRIRTISYDNRIFYHKMVNGEVAEFKELTT